MSAGIAVAQEHPLQVYWDRQLAGLEADALRVALQLQLPEQLARCRGMAELARALAVDAGRLEKLIELLWAMGVVERVEASVDAAGRIADAGPVYRLAPALAPYLSLASPLYCGDALLYRHKVLRQSGAQLDALLLPDEGGSVAAQAPAVPGAAGRAWAAAARLQIAQEQRAASIQGALSVLERLPEYPESRYLLDLGGGPGLVAVALAQRLPMLEGVIFEYPEVAAVAQENIDAAGLSSRLRAQGGDIARDDFGQGYDLVWCSSVLHFVPDVPALLVRLFRALKPGGVLVCCHAQVDSDSAVPPDHRVLAYYLNMRMMGRHVLPARETAGQLRQAGFASVELAGDICFPVAPVTALVARKARQAM